MIEITVFSGEFTDTFETTITVDDGSVTYEGEPEDRLTEFLDYTDSNPPTYDQEVGGGVRSDEEIVVHITSWINTLEDPPMLAYSDG